eukprot:TRINITY_DN2306_c0_g1_i1.p1 TRINITY_DN2306_c0_g1~~TRINITY_DN2306_c0_g1_i1.p1  ORF type:complete len:288 (+),score=72.49 TRINITY_DN2306_c0_g1_i1:47-865(+)
MLGGRDRIGHPTISWREASLGIGKYRRKTFGFGSYVPKERRWTDEIHIRELSIIDGGIGCATWDAAVILSRWLMRFPEIVRGKRVLELGSGVGLPGIISARCGAQEVILTDYLDSLVENISYNIVVNGVVDEANCVFEGDSEKIAEEASWRKRISDVSKAKFLDWMDAGTSKAPDWGKFDVVMGSELTYTGDADVIDGLVRCIETYLLNTSDGVFIEILSDDRDGVPVFREKMRAAGFVETFEQVPEEMTKNTKTGQLPETYKIYSYRKTKL